MPHVGKAGRFAQKGFGQSLRQAMMFERVRQRRAQADAAAGKGQELGGCCTSAGMVRSAPP